MCNGKEGLVPIPTLPFIIKVLAKHAVPVPTKLFLIQVVVPLSKIHESTKCSFPVPFVIMLQVK